VTLRQHSLITTEGRPRGQASPNGEVSSYDFDTELVLPLTNPATVLHIRILNGSAVLGQWFMTTKYLLVCPTHCKHSSLRQHKDGAISGTFLLCDAKLRGSAVRGLGPHDMGTDGYCGEIELGMHWVHSELVPPPPKPTPRPPMEQLNEGTAEDTLRLGNFTELKEFLIKVPIRLDVEQMTLRNLCVEMTDLFAGKSTLGKTKGVAKQPAEHSEHRDHKDTSNVVHVKLLDFEPFKQVSLYHFLEVFSKQASTRILTDRGTLASAVGEIFGGIAQNMAHSFKKSLTTTIMSPLSWRANEAA